MTMIKLTMIIIIIKIIMIMIITIILIIKAQLPSVAGPLGSGLAAGGP